MDPAPDWKFKNYSLNIIYTSFVNKRPLYAHRYYYPVVNASYSYHLAYLCNMDTKAGEPEWHDDYIILTNKVDVQFWCKMLNCSEKNLLRAINSMGNSPKAVNNYLDLNRLKENDEG